MTMNNYKNKPKLTSAQLVMKMSKEKGIQFKHITRAMAVKYLQEKNNYMRLASYRKNYEVGKKGSNLGKYESLDFSELIELSTLDMHYRYLVLKMCLDIEHQLKVDLLNAIEANKSENGYDIVKSFLKRKKYVLENITRKQRSTYTGDLVSNYFDLFTVFDTENVTCEEKLLPDCPIWVLVEIISFGDFIELYKFYYSKYSENSLSDSVLDSVRSLRNACAHNNCIMYDLHKGTTKPIQEISLYIKHIPSIGEDLRKAKLSSRPIYEFVCLLYVYEKVVSNSIKKFRYNELRSLINDRCLYHAEYFKNNELLKTSYNFLRKTIDNLK